MSDAMQFNGVMQFWFDTLKPAQWFKQSDEVDQIIRAEFEPTWQQASAGELYTWRQSPEGRLAEIIVLDQFSRNLWRGDARAFSADSMALTLAQEAVARGDHLKLGDQQRPFMLMPYMHSESLIIHDEAVELFSDLENNLDFELRHQAVIQQFGRYPHRNAALGRDSTDEEIAWMKDHKGF